MKRIGSSVWGVILLLVVLYAPTASAAVTAEVDRNRVTLGDTLRLTITASDGEDIDDRDLQPLLKDFEIMQRSTSSNTSIVNGRMSRTRQMTIDLAPLRDGVLVIPPLSIGGSTTATITIEVNTESRAGSDDDKVRFEAEVDLDSVYVQGQIILTLRAQQAVTLDDRSISQLKLDGAFVKPLEQHSFQRTINGQPWLVHELRYAIFPEQSGTLVIPAQTFAGRLNQGQRSFFGHGGGGQLVRRSTQPITVSVLPKPDNFGSSDWLPARKLTLEETWSTPPTQLRVGESATRTIKLVGEGLQGAQLPPVLFSPIDGLKFYPDQPQISEQETTDGLQGIRQDSAAVVPTREGTFVIPEIRIPWWDTQQGKVQYAVLPERHLTAIPGALSDTPTPQSSPSTGSESVPGSVVIPGAASGGGTRFWQALAGLSTLGWLTTLLYLWRKRSAASRHATADENLGGERQALKQLLTACAANNAGAARAAAIKWAAALEPRQSIVSLEQVGRLFGDAQLDRALQSLNASLYRHGTNDWDGEQLAQCARRLQTTQRATAKPGTGQLRLYPQ